MTTQLIDATPEQTGNQEILDFLDKSFADLLNTRSQGEYVKIGDVSDIILDIRQKVKQLSI